MRVLRLASAVLVVVMGGALVAARPARAGPPESVASSGEDARALAEARAHVERGGAVDAFLDDDDVQLLGFPAQAVTRLHRASEGGWTETARFLLDHGASPVAVAGSKSHYNRLRPIDLALHGGHAAVLRLLKERALPPVGATRTLEVDLGTGEDALPLVSLEEGTWWRVTERDAGRPTTADLLVEPGDPEVSGLGGTGDLFRHALDETAVAPLAPGTLAPDGRPTAPIAWRPSLTHREFRADTDFLVRTSVGAVFRARLQDVDLSRRRFTLRYVRLPDATSLADAPRIDTSAVAATADGLLAAAAFEGDAQAVARRLAAGADPMAKDAQGRNALHAAALQDRADVAALLVQHILGEGEGGIPSFDRFVEAKEGLLEAGDRRGLTPLHVAAFEGHVATVRALLRLGADADATDALRRTPLLLAASRGHGEVVQALLEQGASLHAQDAKGRSARELASTPVLARYLEEMARRRPDTERRNVEEVVGRFVEGLRAGDREAVLAVLAPEAAAALPAALTPLPCPARVAFLRVGPREAQARVVLARPRAAKDDPAALVTLTLAKEGGMGAWQVTGLAIRSCLAKEEER